MSAAKLLNRWSPLAFDASAIALSSCLPDEVRFDRRRTNGQAISWKIVFVFIIVFLDVVDDALVRKIFFWDCRLQ